MATTPIDYTALAAQARGGPAPQSKIDYAAMAAQVRSGSPAVAGAGPMGTPQPNAPAVNMQPSMLAPDAQPGPVTQALRGALKGAGHTINMGEDWAAKNLPAWVTTPIGQAPTPENSAASVARYKQLTTPVGTAQKVGYGGEQAGEFLAPTGLEEAGAKLLPWAGRAGEVIGKMAGSGVHSGVINSAQGGSCGGGAAMGAAGSGVGEPAKSVAPLLAETALGVRALDRAAGRTPGQAIMTETTGIKPGVIASQAARRMSSLTSDLDGAAQEARGPASLVPARDAAQSWHESALLRNEPSAIKKTAQLVDQLHNWSGAAGAENVSTIPPDISPMQMLRFRRGMGDVPGSWNPATTTDFSDRAAKDVYSKLGDEVSRTVPGADALDDRISSLFPVAKRAGAADLNAGVLQRSLGRLAKPTGALFGAGAGGTMGYREGGVPGAVAGAGLGLIAPEVLASPTTLMMEARAANSPALRKFVLPAAQGAAMQLFRPPTQH